ncbi:MAG TPA: 30S ribosomal protein S6 [bacterium]|nr:30S ribosomal protein S6 [bacterium]
MPSYDLVYIVRPDLEPDALKAVIDRVGQRIIDRGGKIDATEPWGKRRLSHVIRKQREGVYVQTRFTIAPDQVAEIRHQVALSEEVLRSMLTIAVGKLPAPAAPSPAPGVTTAAPSPAAGATAAVALPNPPPPSPAPAVAPKPTEA